MGYVARWLLGAVLAFGLAACTKSDLIPPTLELGEAKAQRLRWNGTAFVIPVDVVNRNPQTIRFESADYTLTVGDVKVATGSARPRVSAGPGVTATSLPLDINYFRLLEAARKRRDLILPTNEIQGTLTGVVITRSGWFDSQETPFERSVNIPLRPDAWNGEFPLPKMLPGE